MADIKLKVHEFFVSIQGEGVHAGRPMHFIRLSGCNLKCVYCDIEEHESGTFLSLNEITAIVSDPDLLPIFITGGEPLIQRDVLTLTTKLLADNREVHLETNGSLDLSGVSEEVFKSIDVKTPGSGSPDSFLESNLEYITGKDEIKFIVTSQDDFKWGVKKVRDWGILSFTSNVIFQPAWGIVDPKDLAEWAKSCTLPVRMGLQIHKYIWGPDVKGV